MNVEDVLDLITDCCYHEQLQFDPSTVETLAGVGWCECGKPNPQYKTCGSYCDSGSVALGNLPDGRVVVVSEWSDTSGHGCRCDGLVSIHDTLGEAWRLGLTKEQRRKIAPYLLLDGKVENET